MSLRLIDNVTTSSYSDVPLFFSWRNKNKWVRKLYTVMASRCQCLWTSQNHSSHKYFCFYLAENENIFILCFKEIFFMLFISLSILTVFCEIISITNSNLRMKISSRNSTLGQKCGYFVYIDLNSYIDSNFHFCFSAKCLWFSGRWHQTIVRLSSLLNRLSWRKTAAAEVAEERLIPTKKLLCLN